MAAVVQQNDLVFEFASNVMEDEQQVWMILKRKLDFNKSIIMSFLFVSQLLPLKDSRRNY